MKRRRVIGSWILILVIASAIANPPAGSYAAALKLGAMGDSLTDEYWDDGVSSYATNWPQLVVKYRGVDMGPTAVQAGTNTWGSPRNHGYKYNWALGGATSASLLSGGQAKGLAAQASSEGVATAVLIIGGNDYYPGGSAYTNIYLGTWTQSQITNYGNSVLTNIEKAVVMVQTAGVAVGLGTVVDPGATPVVASYATDGTARDRVAVAISGVNTSLKDLANRRHVPLMDLYALEKAVFGPNTNLNSTLTLGNVRINLRGSDSGSAHTNAFVSDGYHPNTVLQGIFANVAMQAWNSAYGATLPLFSEQEILSAALIPYGGSDTLQAQIGAYTNYVYVPTNIPPNVIIWPYTATIPRGSNATFAAAATSRQSCVYQWRLNSQPLAGATATNLDVLAAQCANAGSYDVVVSNDSGSSTSVVAVLTVVSPPGCSAQPTNRTVVVGQSATFRVTATNSCGGGSKYQWQKASVSIGGATASSLVITNAQSSDAGSYSVVVTNLGGSFTSAAATLTVIVPPVISSPPAGQVLARGADASFSVSATGTGPLAYSWRFGGVAVAGATDSAYTRTAIGCSDAGGYDVIVTNAVGSATSSAAILTVVSPPNLVAPPTNQSVALGQTATFGVSATNDCGGAPAYQWQYAGTNLPGATATSLIITNAQASNEGLYTVVVTNLAGSVTSAVATLTFFGPPSIGSSLSGRWLLRGADALLSVHAIGNEPLAYQWRRSRVPLPDATNSICALTNAQCGDAGLYDVVVTNDFGSVTGRIVLVTVFSPLVLVAQPTNQTVVAGQTAAFSFSVTNDCGGTLTYQWQYAGTNLSGATAPTLSITNAQSTNAGAYTAVAASFAGAITSEVATLTVTNLPLLVLAPPNLDFGVAFIGRTASASLVVSNAGVVGLSGTATLIGGPFSIAGSSGAGLSVPALSSTNLVIQFQPLAAGVFSNAIVFATDGGGATGSLAGLGADWPVILPAAPAGTGSVFYFPTIPGKTYAIEYKDFLEDPEWLPLQTVAGDGSTHSITNSISATSQRFYRLSAY